MPPTCRSECRTPCVELTTGWNSEVFLTADGALPGLEGLAGPRYQAVLWCPAAVVNHMMILHSKNNTIGHHVCTLYFTDHYRKHPLQLFVLGIHANYTMTGAAREQLISRHGRQSP